jgi:hypothetical protein
MTKACTCSPHCCKCLSKCVWPACLDRNERQPERLGGLPRGRQPVLNGHNVRIEQNAYAGEVRQCFLQQPKSLSIYLAASVRAEPGHVPAGVRQTGNEPGTDRIDTVGHDDWDGRGCLHRRNRIRIVPSDNDVNAEPDQICGQRGQPFQFAVGEAILGGDILANAIT